MDATRQTGFRQLDMALEVTPETLEHVRSTVRVRLLLWDREQLVPDVLLGVVELMTNVYKHAVSRHCRLRMEETADGVRVAVSDRDRARPRLREPDHEAESGRGLHLLDHVCCRWGVEMTLTGKDVWFECAGPRD